MKFKEFCSLYEELLCRWEDEKDFEDINEYKSILQKALEPRKVIGLNKKFVLVFEDSFFEYTLTPKKDGVYLNKKNK